MFDLGAHKVKVGRARQGRQIGGQLRPQLADRAANAHTQKKRSLFEHAPSVKYRNVFFAHGNARNVQGYPAQSFPSSCMIYALDLSRIDTPRIIHNGPDGRDCESADVSIFPFAEDKVLLGPFSYALPR